MTTNFKKLNTNIYQKIDSATEDNIYWKKLGTPVLVKEFGPIDYVDFSPIEPYHFAITCSVRVQIYNPITKLVVKNLSRFRESAYGATFKSDGKLICAGSEEGVVKLFDVQSKIPLRIFKGHTAAVHRNFFIPSNTQIISCSDDKTVKLWDLPTQTQILSFSEHEDYVRSGATNPALPNIFISGGYDNKINMYDSRTNKVVHSFDHGAPVESLLFLPSGGLFLSAGGNDIKVWDSLSSRKSYLQKVTEHHKTVTCMALASDNTRILSGSLDRHVKVYDLNCRVVHTFDFPNSILSLGVSKNDETLVAGFVDGIISIQRRKEEKIKEKENIRKKETEIKEQVDIFIPEVTLEKETKYDKYLRKFQYSKALDAVFLKYVTSKTPEKTVAVLDELIKRKALSKALRDKDEEFIKKFLSFLIRQNYNSKFFKILLNSFEILQDVINCSPPNDEIKRLSKIYKSMYYEHYYALRGLSSVSSMLRLSASLSTRNFSTTKDNLQLLPSNEAQQNLILDIN